VVGSVTAEQLDLMTLEQVRMWNSVRRQAADSRVGATPDAERAQGKQESLHRWGLPREVMNRPVEPGTRIESSCGFDQTV
jgi:hypothetical protein